MAEQCPIPPNRRKSCDYADQAAKSAVKETFAIMGVDVDDPHDVEDFRRGLRFGNDMRKMADKGRIALFLFVVSAIAGAFWTGLKIHLK